MDEVATRQIISRLRRAGGQIEGVIAMIESGRSCREVVTQLAAASSALHKAGYKLISSNMQECLLDDSPEAKQTAAELERLFINLA
ncbi:MAG TPA: metal-sensitive transcriptional regulator [Kineosporiaceae bacterium]|nr:metal-sensitive transcriptional regulator [Kineosporiaceae bacterium]